MCAEPAEAPWGVLCRYFHLVHRLNLAERERHELKTALDWVDDPEVGRALWHRLQTVTALAFKLRLSRAAVEANWLRIVRNQCRVRQHHPTRFLDPNLLP